MPGKKKTKPELRVVFDTSVLFTQVAYDLVKSEVRQLIEANSKHPDLSIRWYLPSIVIDERRYQMQCKARELLPYITKLEKLLGHNLNITDDILASRVDDAIEKQLGELEISKLNIDITKVDWENLMHRSVNRHPPFEHSDKEKGFRDALIAETFLQLVKQSPVTPNICRLAIVTGDGLLKEYITSSTPDTKNVRILSAINELESLINTLVSEVTEEFVAVFKKKADDFFFVQENKATLYYKKALRDKIKASYGDQLKEVPSEGLFRENGTFWIADPVFVKKERQRIFWITPVYVEFKLFKYERQETTTERFAIPPSPLQQFAEQNVVRKSGRGLPEPLKAVPERVDVVTGQSQFEIYWSTNITQGKKLTFPRIDKIQFVGTKWEKE